MSSRTSRKGFAGNDLLGSFPATARKLELAICAESLGLSHVDLVQALVALIQDKVLQLVQFQVLINRSSV